MNIVIFGSGPMPCEPQYPVLAPGARTWQILQTAAGALAASGRGGTIRVCGLEAAPRPEAAAHEVPVALAAAPGVEITYLPRTFDEFVTLAGPEVLGQTADAVIGCASVQPCATAADYAARAQAPLWVDLFGDPIAEVQSRAQLEPHARHANDDLYVHVWRLLLRALVQGDRFSALSLRQREALIGQLGAAGRLGRRTRGEHLVHALPYALFPDDLQALTPAESPAFSWEGEDSFTVMWCGSFNTWMDAGTLVEGVSKAFSEEPRLRLLVAGGRIRDYHENSFEHFRDGMERAGLSQRIEYADWCSLQETRGLYARCDAGLSIDRFTYEALLGSRTRIVNLVAAGKPVISTVITELTSDLARDGFVRPFEAGSGADLARALVETARLGRDGAARLGARGRAYVAGAYGGETCGLPLARWIVAPAFARDKGPQGGHDLDNPLIRFWKEKVIAG